MSDDFRPARRFALTAATAGAAFGIPLFLDPYRWGRAFGWPREPETDIGLYFGRCLGGLALAASIQGALAARDPKRHPGYFRFSEAAGWFLAAAHVRGLLEKRQPPIEHAEILGWSALAIGARRYAPGSRG
jgi:hypothetical protein